MTEALEASSTRRPSNIVKIKDKVVDEAKSVVVRVDRTARNTAQASVDALSGNPMAAVAGALALGAIAAALIPATRREISSIGPAALRARSALGGALNAARAAGTGELSAAGLTLTAATTGLSGLLGTLINALAAATSAAAVSARENKAGPAPTVPEAMASGDPTA